jgi:hypothetical protein
MSNLTPELALAQAVDDDDTADYLTLNSGLAGSLAIIDGLFSQSTGHKHSGARQGGTLGAEAFADNTLPGAKLVDGSVTNAKLATPITQETLFAGSWVNTGTNYTVATGVMFVFATAAITVTLPAANVTNRPITVAAVTGQSTVAAVGGSIIGGSANQTTGAVMNGTILAGEAFTYKSDGTNWRAV